MIVSTSTNPNADVAGTSIELREFSVRAGDRVLLEKVDARFDAGKITLVIGPSGAGKSVLMRVLAGLDDGDEISSSGDLNWKVDGHDNSMTKPRVGVVFQHFAIFDELSPRENVRFAADHRSSRSKRRNRKMNSDHLLGELGVPEHTKTAKLSGGQRQRLAIARTLAYDPEVILYDEPTSGLDPATASTVAELIRETQSAHQKTSVVVTHDYQSLVPIADCIYFFDPESRTLEKISPEDWRHLDSFLDAAKHSSNRETEPVAESTLKKSLSGVAGFLESTSHVGEQLLQLPLRLLPIWRNAKWGTRFVLHYLWLVAGPTAWLYMVIAGAIIGFVTTYFTFRFLPYPNYTKPLLIDELLASMGFSLYRILVPVMATVLIAARCGAAIASDVGGKMYGRQIDALRTFGVSPKQYLLTGVLYSLLIGAPLLTLIGYAAASLTSLVVFTSTHVELGATFWDYHFHRHLTQTGDFFYLGTDWLIVKTLCCALGIGSLAYYIGAAPKWSPRSVSSGITSTILWTTLYVLVVHFVFAFFEFD